MMKTLLLITISYLFIGYLINLLIYIIYIIKKKRGSSTFFASKDELKYWRSVIIIFYPLFIIAFIAAFICLLLFTLIGWTSNIIDHIITKIEKNS